MAKLRSYWQIIQPIGLLSKTINTIAVMNHLETDIRIKSYGFKELATLYLPDIQAKSASRRLRAWIQGNMALSKRLNELGYSSQTRVLTPEMVKHIFKSIGYP